MFTAWEDLSRQEQLASEYYDFYKDVHGIRPRWIYNEVGCVYSEQELEEMLVDLSKQADVVFAEEAARYDAAAIELEQRIQNMIETGAQDRNTAIRWLHDAEETNGDDEYLCFKLGVRYGYFFKKVV